MKLVKKLVRDKMPAIIESEEPGKFKFYESLSIVESRQLLAAKLREETEEIIEEMEKESVCCDSLKEELADLQEVIDIVASCNFIPADALRRKKNMKAMKKGGFSKLIVMETV